MKKSTKFERDRNGNGFLIRSIHSHGGATSGRFVVKVPEADKRATLFDTAKAARYVEKLAIRLRNGDLVLGRGGSVRELQVAPERAGEMSFRVYMDTVSREFG